jgi:hypothetical protein
MKKTFQSGFSLILILSLVGVLLVVALVGGALLKNNLKSPNPVSKIVQNTLKLDPPDEEPFEDEDDILEVERIIIK